MEFTRKRTPNIQVTGFPHCAKAITPSNTVDLQNYAGQDQHMTIRVGAGGAVKYLPLGNADGDFITQTFADGEYIPVLVRRVFATGTTATGLVGYF